MSEKESEQVLEWYERRPAFESQAENKAGEFRRYEDKFLIDKQDIAPILTSAKEFMNPSYLDHDTTFTLIESMYFDSPEFDFFVDHFMGKETRYKMRLRRYGPNGQWTQGRYLMELKIKKQGESKKIRFDIGDYELESIRCGQGIELNPPLREVNPAIKRKTLKNRIDRFNEIISEYHLIPTISIVYRRMAFEKDGFRLTFDQDISGTRLSCPYPSTVDKVRGNEVVRGKVINLLKKFDSRRFVVMEVKHQGIVPQWMIELSQRYALHKTSFSKYCWFLSQDLFPSSVFPALHVS